MNLKKILLSALALGALTAQAQKTPVWCDPNVNEINRKMDVANYFAYESEALAQQSQTPKANTKAKSSRYLSIEGKWKFHWVESANERPADFYTLKYDDSKWGTMPVPGIWELNGYGGGFEGGCRVRYNEIYHPRQGKPHSYANHALVRWFLE